ncbi:protein kinase [Lipomyces kononenkoae]
MNQIKASLLRVKYLSRLSELFGSAFQSSSERLNSCQITEEPDLYKIGGFHRVSLGDTFDSGKYAVLRKLGYGQYSTVWLARDSKEQRYVALKMLRADCYGGHHDIFEREILSSEISGNSNHEGRHYVSHLLDGFQHEGPNGKHVCFVFDVLGHHLDFQSAKYEDGKLPVKAVKVIARQLLLGLDFLHRECGIIHTDLKPTNILLELQSPDEAISRYLSEVPPRTGHHVGAAVPLREVITTPLLSEMNEPHLRIIDFGVASWRDNRLSDLVQSPALRAPEVTIGAPWNGAVDIWSLGCLIVEFVQGLVLFSGEASRNGTWTADDDRLARIIEILGPFPLQLLKRGKRTTNFFGEKVYLIPNAAGLQEIFFEFRTLKPTSLERLINGTTKPFLKPTDMPDAEVPIFIDFLRGMLAIDPERRKSAADLLQHGWINL